MRTYLYLLYAEGGELAGLECGFEINDSRASAVASLMLSADSGARSVEVWRDGRLINSADAAIH
jgi:hypothetical protein